MSSRFAGSFFINVPLSTEKRIRVNQKLNGRYSRVESI